MVLTRYLAASCMYKGGNSKSLNLNSSNCGDPFKCLDSVKHVLLFGVGLQHLKRKIINFIFFRKNSDFPCHLFTMEKALVKIIFRCKFFICELIFKIFVALFKTFGMWNAKE